MGSVFPFFHSLILRPSGGISSFQRNMSKKTVSGKTIFSETKPQGKQNIAPPEKNTENEKASFAQKTAGNRISDGFILHSPFPLLQIGGRRFRRLLSVLGRPCTDFVQPEGVSRRFRSGKTRRTAAKRDTERYALHRWLAISPPIKRFGTPVYRFRTT